jgi:hypothetical protein
MNVAEVTDIMSELTLLKYFPGDPGARIALVGMVCRMASDETQVRWLVDRMFRLYNEWPGHMELRACFCSKFRPRDGVNAHSEIYRDGIPSENGYDPTALQLPGNRDQQRAIARAMLKQLEAPGAAPDAMKPDDLPSVRRKVVRETVPEIPLDKKIAQDDIERAVRESRERQLDKAVRYEGHSEVESESGK